ncbi:MAG: outer membrane protein assembly factor BamD [Pelagibacterales bacterium MED-G42]|nr:MAG: outer membrane protein assembly factor BamD [Pelagibacterales bacterium MED-G42]
MKIKYLFLLLVLSIFCFSCSKKDSSKISIISEKNIELQILESYREGLEELEDGDALYAAKKFNEVEIMFPQSDWAPKSTLMAAYAYYSQQYYFDTIEELKIFIRKYPKHKNIDYAHYLMGIVYYEQIVDEKKDLKSIISAKEKFNYVVKEFPDTDYALDATFKLDLIDNILASKEMYLGRYYFSKKKWIPAINRFRKIIDDYETTIYAQEALHRLVEVYYVLGLNEESEKYAYLLGYNYQSSEWYKKSYAVFDKQYEKNQKKKRLDKKEGNIIKRTFKSLFD